MVSAGLDTVPGNLSMCLAYLSSPHGQAIQRRAHAEIQAAYPSGDAWERCLFEEKVPYVTALVKEVLRFWTVIPICLPRVNIKDISWDGAVIPAGTTFFMNAWAADYDGEHFSRPDEFDPERYLDPAMDGSGTPHFGYGAGSRCVCPCFRSPLPSRGARPAPRIADHASTQNVRRLAPRQPRAVHGLPAHHRQLRDLRVPRRARAPHPRRARLQRHPDGPDDGAQGVQDRSAAEGQKAAAGVDGGER